MIVRVIEFCLQQRALVIGAFVILIALGIQSFERLPVQAWLALAIIFAGIAIASIRPARGSAS